MTLLGKLKVKFSKAKKYLHECDNLDILLGFVNYVPTLVGLSFFREKETVTFWIVHFSLLFYVYVVGSIMYQVNQAVDAIDFIKSNVNVALLVFIASNSWWYIKRRVTLQEVLKNIKDIDEKTKTNVHFEKKHKRILTIIMRILFVFYAFNYINLSCVYLPNRMKIQSKYGMTSCVGLHPLNTYLKKGICYSILGLQELTISLVVLNFQCLLLLLVAHTAGMYQILADDILLLNDYENLTEHKVRVRKVLPGFTERHISIIKVVKIVRFLYSMPIGVNFGGNSVCLTLFFCLPTEEWLQFMPVLVYCGLVFTLYCFLCQQLVNAAEKFEQAVYCCGWESFALSEKKMVYVMLLQAQKPIEILAADIIAVNMATFASTLQAMYKFMTVLKF